MAKKRIKSEDEIHAALDDLVPTFVTSLEGEKNPLVVGITTGGKWLADALHARVIKKITNTELGSLNIGLYRDDFHHRGLSKNRHSTQLPHSLENRHIILVDDVLHSGRTIRAALNALFDRGRPARITLVVLANRDGRQLPIQADYALFSINPEPNARLELTGPDKLELWLVGTPS